MVNGSGFIHLYAKIMGEHAIFAHAQAKLMINLDRITKIRTHTFLKNNAQNAFGVSQNFSENRYYFWGNTIIDCRFLKNTAPAEHITGLEHAISTSQKFKLFKEKIETLSQQKINVSPACPLQRGTENMRFDIRCNGGAVIDFDLIRVGIRLHSTNEQEFKDGLELIRRAEDPLYCFKPTKFSHKKIYEPA